MTENRHYALSRAEILEALERVDLATHTCVLLVVHDASDLDADLDTALETWIEGLGMSVAVVDPTDVAGNLHISAFDLIIVSGSCVAADVADLANLRTADVPLICHSAAIAASAVLNMGGTAHSHTAQTEIELIDNTVVWLIDQDLGDLAVTASAEIFAMNTKATAAVTLAEEATGTGDHLTIVMLSGGDDDGATPAYAAFYDRFFIGVADYTNMNSVWKGAMSRIIHHLIHEKRYTLEELVQVKRAFQEDIPDTDFALAAIDDALTDDPPAADAENSILDIDLRHNRAYVLRSWWVNVTDFGTGTQLTFQLWVPLNGVITSVNSVVVNALGIQNLVDIFGLQEVHADGIWITVITDAGNTGACSGTFRYAEARR